MGRALAAERQASWRAWPQDSVLDGATHAHRFLAKAKLPAPPLQTPSVFAELKSQAATWSQQWRSCPSYDVDASDEALRQQLGW